MRNPAGFCLTVCLFLQNPTSFLFFPLSLKCLEDAAKLCFKAIGPFDTCSISVGLLRNCADLCLVWLFDGVPTQPPSPASSSTVQNKILNLIFPSEMVSGISFMATVRPGCQVDYDSVFTYTAAHKSNQYLSLLHRLTLEVIQRHLKSEAVPQFRYVFQY